MTRTRGRKIDTRTIQTWPGGASFEYRGDPYGPDNQRSLRAGHYQARIRCANECRRTWVERGALYMQGSAAPLSSVFVDACDDPRAGKHCIGDPLNYPERVGLCPYCKGEGFTDNPVANNWRKGTAAEWRQIRIALRAERIASEDILCCDSSLVDDLIKLGGYTSAGRGGGADLGEAFGIDEIRNLYADPSDWDADQCRAYAEDNGIELPPIPRIGDSPQVDDAALEDEWLPEAREACRDHAQDNPAEPYEWWRVSQWLCNRLHEIGRVTIDNNYGCWWGRTCTGQGLIMDGVLQEIAAAVEELV